MTGNIPRANLKTVKEVIAGSEKVGEKGEEVPIDKVSEVRDVSLDNAKRQRKFLSDLGIFEKDGHSYLLTEKGETIGEYLRFNQDEEARKEFKAVLDQWEPLEEILSHVDSEISEEDLKQKIAFVTNTELSGTRKKSGAKGVVQLLEWTGYVEENNGNYIRTHSDETENTDSEEGSNSKERGQNLAADSNAAEEVSRKMDARVSSSSPKASFDIEISLDGDEDPENVKKIVEGVLQALDND